MRHLCVDTPICIKIMLNGFWYWLHLVALQKEDLNNWMMTVRMPPKIMMLLSPPPVFFVLVCFILSCF